MRWLFIVLISFIMIGTATALPMCEDTIEIISNCSMVTPYLLCSDYTYQIINVTNSKIIESDNLTLINSSIYYFNFTHPEGDYVITLCDQTTAQVMVREEDDNKMILFGLILLPIILGAFFLFGANTLGEQHPALKIFLFLLAIPTFFVSMHFALLGVIRYYNFLELQNVIGTTTYWVGWIFAVIITYFIIYIFYLLIHEIAQRRKDKLEY